MTEYSYILFVRITMQLRVSTHISCHWSRLINMIPSKLLSSHFGALFVAQVQYFGCQSFCYPFVKHKTQNNILRTYHLSTVPISVIKRVHLGTVVWRSPGVTMPSKLNTDLLMTLFTLKPLSKSRLHAIHITQSGDVVTSKYIYV